MNSPMESAGQHTTSRPRCSLWNAERGRREDVRELGGQLRAHVSPTKMWTPDKSNRGAKYRWWESLKRGNPGNYPISL